jgi:nicotinate-nucleotide adenylyltransferase
VNIAVLGGTFDPVHNGHLAVAAVVSEKLSPVEIIFMPAGQPWLKKDRLITRAGNRLEMVRLAIRGNASYRLSTAETDRSGPTYTLDTILELKDRVKPPGELYFILGWDKLEELPKWHKPGEIIKLVKLVAVPRIGFPVPDLSALDKLLPGISRCVILLDKPEVDITSSVVRERVSLGLPISHLVPPAVEAYIKAKGLYKNSSTSLSPS